MLKSFAAVLAFAGSFIGITSARADFIDDYLDGHRYCGSVSGPIYSFDHVAPFGKKAADWTDDDLEHLKDAIAACSKAALTVGQRPDFFFLAREVPEAVLQSRLIEARHVAEKKAAERLKANEDRRKAADVQGARVRAEEDQKGAEKERARIQNEADTAVARGNALIAAAHARRDAAFARQKAAAIEADVKAAEAEATSAEQTKPAIHTSADVADHAKASDAPKPSALTKAEAPTSDKPEVTGPREVSVSDIQLEGEKMAGEHVVVRGYVSVFSDQGATIYRHEDDMNGIDLRLEGSHPATRRYIVEHCGRLSRVCRMVLKGTVVMSDEGRPEVEVE